MPNLFAKPASPPKGVGPEATMSSATAPAGAYPTKLTRHQ
jgi:hypothetical protein